MQALLWSTAGSVRVDNLVHSDWLAVPQTLGVLSLAFVFQNVVPVVCSRLEVLCGRYTADLLSHPWPLTVHITQRSISCHVLASIAVLSPGRHCQSEAGHCCWREHTSLDVCGEYGPPPSCPRLCLQGVLKMGMPVLDLERRHSWQPGMVGARARSGGSARPAKPAVAKCRPAHTGIGRLAQWDVGGSTWMPDCALTHMLRRCFRCWLLPRHT